jgi:hypothetical protein
LLPRCLLGGWNPVLGLSSPRPRVERGSPYQRQARSASRVGGRADQLVGAGR